MNITWLVVVLLMAAGPWGIKIIFPQSLTRQEVFISMLVGAICFSAFFFMGRYTQSLDYEIWSGSITGKSRDHGHYTRDYDCNCRRVCTGSGSNESCTTQCDTCQEDHYTVTWEAQSNIGNFRIRKEDSTSRKIYMTPDPHRYQIIRQGDPVSKTVAFTNYVKAVPESVFHGKKIDPQFANLIVPYPDNIYDIYHINRVLAVGGVPVDDLQAWNGELAGMMCELGPLSKSNIVIVFVNTADRAYIESLKTAWLNGKKNDVIVVFGTTSYPKIDWVEVFGWTQEELFKVELQQDLEKMDTIERAKVLQTIHDHVKKNFKYRDMEDFNYLSNAIDPPIWVTALGWLVSVLLAGGVVFFMRSRRR